MDSENAQCLNQVSRVDVTECPPLLPTLVTWAGMVLGNGEPKYRPQPHNDGSVSSTEKSERARNLRRLCHSFQDNTDQLSNLVHNFQACSASITTSELLEYMKRDKRIDVEQAVAMVISYIFHNSEDDIVLVGEDEVEDDFEASPTTATEELINDSGTLNMLSSATMWRESRDYDFADDSREAGRARKLSKLVGILNSIRGLELKVTNSADMIAFLQSIRRRRTKLQHSQHLVLPPVLLPIQGLTQSPWSLENSYKTVVQVPISHPQPLVISKIKFRSIQTVLSSLGPPVGLTRRYVHDIDVFLASSSSVSSTRLAALGESDDIFALTYSFLAFQRRAQLKVVSDMRWSRFLVKGEGAMILQNRPDVMTSFEDILVRRAWDLKALTAVSCPKGVRDHFNSEAELLLRVRKICEFMERYVDDFGAGRMSSLTFSPGVRGGTGRGPVDVYNLLCDELRECKARHRAVTGSELDIQAVHKFLAKDIMAWNNAWEDDAFAGGKIPGWVEYLARIRLESVTIAE